MRILANKGTLDPGFSPMDNRNPLLGNFSFGESIIPSKYHAKFPVFVNFSGEKAHSFNSQTDIDIFIIYTPI